MNYLSCQADVQKRRNSCFLFETMSRFIEKQKNEQKKNAAAHEFVAAAFLKNVKKINYGI